MNENNIHSHKKFNPVLIGIFALVATVALGVGIAFATGLVTPPQAFAQVVTTGPCCMTAAVTSVVTSASAAATTVTTAATAATAAAAQTPPAKIVGCMDPAATNYDKNATDPAACTYPPPPEHPAPICTLTASATSIASGASATLSWATSYATSASIDSGIGAITPNVAGSRSITPSSDTTYTLTASGDGGTVHCSASVTIVAPPPPVWTNYCTGANDPHPWQIWAYDDSTPPNYKYIGTDPSCAPPEYPAPTCTLTADPAYLLTGGSSTLTWTTAHATSASLDHSIGAVTPIASGSKSVSPTADTTYTLTVTGDGGTAHCSASVTVTTTPPPPDAPTCTLTASPSAVNAGDHATLTWTTTNADTFTIDQSVGSVTPAVGGTISSHAINTDTTFTGTAVGPTGKTTTCTAVVTVNTGGGGGGGPSCTMTTIPSSIVSGNTATLTWGGSEISSVDIDNGIATATSSPGSTPISPTDVGSHTYTGTFHAQNGQTLTCSATLTVTGGGGGGGGGCTSNCGGGGGGGTPPTITLAALPHVGVQPLAYLYLSQIPYTGIDLGPVGTALYWLALIGWSIALAYLVIFAAVPFARRSARTFGARVSAALNAEKPAPVPGSLEQPDARPEEDTVAAHEMPRGYSSYDGFKSFAHNGALSIDDIVKSLSRQHPTASVPHAEEPVANIEPVYEAVEPIYEHVEPIDEVLAEVAEEPGAAPVSANDLTAALVAGDRAAVFSGLRAHVRGGGVPERLVSSVACSLDDTYRTRVDGSPCDATLARLTARLDTPTLEKLVAALTTAIDSSYSDGVTGAKLAFTRALSVLGA